MSGLGGSRWRERDLVTSRLPGADEVFGPIIFVGIDAVVRSTAGIDVKRLEDVGKKLRQSL